MNLPRSFIKHIKYLNYITLSGSTIIYRFVSTMLDSWHQYFIKKTLPILTSEIDFNRSKLFIADHTTTGSGTSTHAKNHISNVLVESFLTESYLLNCGFKSFEAALLVLRITKSVDCRLQALDFDQFFNLLDTIVRRSLHAKSFDGRTVISIEGLEGSGKTALLQNLCRGCAHIKTYDEDTIPLVKRLRPSFMGMPQPIAQAFEFVCHYIIAYDIMCTDPITSEGDNVVFVIERYYHHHCCSSICASVAGEADVPTVFSNAFEWPLDLPRPDLVLFLTLPTAIRLKRLQNTMMDSISNSNSNSSSHSHDPASPTSRADPSIMQKLQSRDRRAGVGTRRSSVAAINTRTARVAARDAKSNLVYSLIRGPGTVGLDSAVSIQELVNTSLEALEYFGVYAISRHYIYHIASLETSCIDIAMASTPVTAADEGDADHGVMMQLPHCRTIEPTFETESRLAVDDYNDENRHNSHSYNHSNCHSISGRDSSTVGTNKLPQLPEGMILDRRVSMGVYSLFTRF